MTPVNSRDRAIAPWFDVQTEQDLVYELFRGPGEFARSTILPGFEVGVDELLAAE